MHLSNVLLWGPVHSFIRKSCCLFHRIGAYRFLARYTPAMRAKKLGELVGDIDVEQQGGSTNVRRAGEDTPAH